MDEVIVDSIRSKFQEVSWSLLQSDKTLDLDIKFRGRSASLDNFRLKSVKLILKDLDSKEIAGYIKRIRLTFHSLDPFSTFVKFKEEIKRYFNFSPSLRWIVDENKIDITNILTLENKELKLQNFPN
ncbi:hypothetical protein P344_06875 [Spiroplasma mirum ATCC 29335]|uniref:Uncharacterized protein n=2 Tax=Spiroplasma mirum TaxID=2144 RepID=W6AMY5_9MOLU|nr:hypothetical protein [Spiroplasma mirum]AHI58673.1 hypothetical protein P344_06875 [Spiroplasma mirum ATCC 29335]